MGFGTRTIAFGVIFIFILRASASGADSRIWTSKKGDVIEAEYVNMFGGKVVLKTNGGKILKVPVAGLCAADQKYLAATVPPRIEISVDIDVNRETEASGYSYDRKSEAIKCSVILKKTNKEPCNRNLTAHIYVFAKKEKGDTRWLVSCVKESVSFTGKNIAQFKTPIAKVQYFKSGYMDSRGFRYEGYLVVVADDAGRVLAMKSNQGKYEKNWSKIKDASKGAQFDRDFDLMEENRSNSWSSFYY